MTKLFKLSVLLIAILTSLTNYAQTPTVQDCLGAIPVCSDSITIPTPYPYAGNGNFLNEIWSTPGCYPAESNGVWFTFTIQAAGALRFEIDPSDPNSDYDWILFNVTNATCATIGTSAAAGIMARSNTWGAWGFNGATGVSTPNGGTGVCNGPGGGNGPKWNADLAVTAGQTYILYVSNWSGSTSGFTIDFSSSTATIYDNIPPAMDTITSSISCDSFNTMTVQFNENILCDSVSTGDFQLTGPNGTHTITSVTSPNCTAGAEYAKTFTLTFSPYVATPGNYTLEIISGAGYVEDVCGNLDTIDSLEFFFGGMPELTLLGTDPLCNSYCTGVIEASGSGGIAPYSFDWSAGLLPDTIQTGLCAGIYNVTLTDSLGCEATGSIQIQEPTPLALSFSSIQNVSCPGSSNCDGGAEVSVTGSNPPYYYDWGNGNYTNSDSTLCAGSNWVTVTDTFGCIDSIEAEILVPDSIITTADQNSTICISNSAPINVASTGGTPPYSYVWTKDSLTGANVSNTASSLVFPVLTTTYFVSSVDARGCIGDTSQMTINVRPPLGVEVSELDTICPYEDIDVLVQGTGGDSNYTYAWSSGDFGANVTLAPDVPTTYTLTVSDACGTPVYVENIFIQVGGYGGIQAEIIPDDDSLCLGEQAILTAEGRGGHKGPQEYRFEWSHTIDSNSIQTVNPSTTKTFTVTITDLCLSEPGIASHVVAVDFAEIPEIEILPAVSCDQANVQFYIDNPNPKHIYDWYLGDGAQLFNTQGATVEHLYQSIGCHDIGLKLTTDFGCVAVDTFDCAVQILQKPTAAYHIVPAYPTNREPIVDLISDAYNEIAVKWYIDGSYYSSEDIFKHEFVSGQVDADSFLVELVAESSDGCLDTITKVIPFRKETIVYFPSSFTPNNDGLNDEFYIKGEAIQSKDFELVIYDRWGEELFRSQNPEEAWDGRNRNGNYEPAGVYPFTLKYRDRYNEIQVISDQVIISRVGPYKGLD